MQAIHYYRIWLSVKSVHDTVSAGLTATYHVHWSRNAAFLQVQLSKQCQYQLQFNLKSDYYLTDLNAVRAYFRLAPFLFGRYRTIACNAKPRTMAPKSSDNVCWGLPQFFACYRRNVTSFIHNLGRHARHYGSEEVPYLVTWMRQVHPEENVVAVETSLYFYQVYHELETMPDSHYWLNTRFGPRITLNPGVGRYGFSMTKAQVLQRRARQGG